MISKARFRWGLAIFVVGQLVPLVIPFVRATDLSPAIKTSLAGILFFVIPQIFIVWAIAVLGKEGKEYLRNRVMRRVEKIAPEVVSPLRYRIGLVMFIVPLVGAWVIPYTGDILPFYVKHEMVFAILGDILLICSFFVLGGEFWDKVRSLFIYRARAKFPE